MISSKLHIASDYICLIIVLQVPSNRLADLKPLVPEILAILTTATKGQATVVST
ncbi:MAG: hypothetical protein ACYTXA_12955 [Nostoc sp.]